MEQESNPNISIDISEEMARGEYANLAVVMSSLSEFVIDFAHITPNSSVAKVKSRVILTPDNAKRLALLLGENLARFEREVSPIHLPEESSANKAPFIDPKSVKGKA